MSTQILHRAIFAAAVSSGITAHANAQDYTYTDLGTGAANAINDAGQVAGTNSSNAVLWNGSTPTILDTLGHYGDSTGINGSGEVTGFDHPSGGNRPIYNALDWNGTSLGILDTQNKTSSIATGINNSGTEVGFVYKGDDTNRRQAVIWMGGNTIALGTTNSHTYSDATAINNGGQEVGYFYQDNHSGMRQAVLWNGTTPTILGTLGSHTSSEATAINNNGQEVGYSDSGAYLHRSAVLWNGSTPTVLGSLGGTNSMALGINNAGDVVGYSYTAGNALKEAVLWEGNKVINLNSYLTSSEVKAGWVLEDATGINSSGAIVGVAENTVTGKTDAFVLNVVSAVPEPGTTAMFLSGLGLIAFVSRRRKTIS
jgi:probable HAF family extracellular repeat protein